MGESVDRVLSSERAVTARFLAAMAGWSVALFGVLRLPWVERYALLPLVSIQEAVAAWYGGRASVPVLVTLDCSGADTMALCAGAVLAYPAPWRARLRGLAAVLPALFALNIVRIGTLALAADRPALFEVMHTYAWPVVLIAATGGLAFGWMHRVRVAERGGPARLTPVFYGVGAIAVAAPWFAPAGVLDWACGAVAGSAAWAMRALGTHAAASGSVLSTARGSFVVTPECLSTPLVPLWIGAVLWWPLTRRQRIAGLAAVLPAAAALAILRLLALSVPGAIVSMPLVLVHGFHQIVLFVGVVIVAAFHGVAANGGRRHALTRGIVAVLLAAAATAALGPSVNRAVAGLASWLAVLLPHTIQTLRPAGDVQGALALLAPYQLALFAAVLWAFGRPARPASVCGGVASLVASQLVLLAVMGGLEASAGIRLHTLVIRGWAAVWPVVAALVVLDRAGAFEPPANGERRYRRFWEKVGGGFPDLGGAASTRFYRDNEKRLIARHLGDLRGKRVLKTDLWDEARNTRILCWMREQGAEVVGIDISRPTIRMAAAEFGEDPLAAAAADVRALPFADGAFDLVYSMGTIEHFAETDTAVRECFRVLKPGGIALVGVPNRRDPFLRPLLVTVLHALRLYGYGFEKSYSRRALRRLVADAGFTVGGEDGILFMPGWLRMLDLAAHAWCRPAASLTAAGVAFFEWIDAHVPSVRRHGYLITVAGARPAPASSRPGSPAHHSAEGSEWIVDAHGCDPAALRSRALLESLFAELLAAGGMRAVAPAQWHVFHGEAGVTGLLMLAESHLACHTYPESAYASFNLYCCRPGGVSFDWAGRLGEVLGARDVSVRVVARGRRANSEPVVGANAPE